MSSTEAEAPNEVSMEELLSGMEDESLFVLLLMWTGESLRSWNDTAFVGEAEVSELAHIELCDAGMIVESEETWSDGSKCLLGCLTDRGKDAVRLVSDAAIVRFEFKEL